MRLSSFLISLVAIAGLVVPSVAEAACTSHPSSANCAIYGTPSGGNSFPVTIHNKATSQPACFYLCQNSGGYTSMALTLEVAASSSATLYVNTNVYYQVTNPSLGHMWLENGGNYANIAQAVASGGLSSFNVYTSSSGSTSRRRLLAMMEQSGIESQMEVEAGAEDDETGLVPSSGRRLLATISCHKMSPA